MPFKTKWDIPVAKKPPVVMKKQGSSTPRPVPPIVAKPVVTKTPVEKPLVVQAPPPPEKKKPDTVRVKPAPAPDFCGPSKQEFMKARRREVFERLAERWPLTFPRDKAVPVRPWAIGIDKDIAALMPDIPLHLVQGALGIFHVFAGWEYLDAIIAGGARYDLEGNPRGIYI